MNKTIVAVTGASGFLGKRLVLKLLDKGYGVRVLIHNNKTNSFGPDVETCYGDLVENKGIQEFLSGANTLIHLAGRFYPPDKEIFSSNVIGTYNLVNNCKNTTIQKFIFSSGIAVYGEADTMKWKEDDEPHPNTVYGISKYIAEKIIQLEDRYGYFILRFPNIYGPGNDKGVIYNFLEAIKNNNPIKIYGDGNQVRDFIYVTDAVESILSTIEYSGSSDIFNICSGTGNTLLETIQKLELISKRKISIEFLPEEKHVVKKLTGNIEKAERVLGWKPKISLETGLQELFNS